jgi:hypothetical protein
MLSPHSVGPAGNRQSGFRIVAEGDRFAIQSRVPVSPRFQKAPDGKAMLYLGGMCTRRDLNGNLVRPQFPLGD